MIIPWARAAAATGAGGAPAVVLPSVNITMTFALLEAGSNSCVGFGKRVRRWVASAGGQRVHSAFQGGYRRDQLRIRRSRIGKADDSNPAAGTDLAIQRTVVSFLDDVNKGVRSELQIGQRNRSYCPSDPKPIRCPSGC